MSDSTFVLDTNFILDYLKGTPAHARFIAESDNPALKISDITRLELLSFPLLNDTEKNRIHDFLEHVEILSVSESIGNIAITFRKETRRKLPDSIIAATAIFLEAPLVTSDKELLFTAFEGLSTIHP